MLVRDLIAMLEGLALQWPELEVMVQGTSGCSTWVGPPNVFWDYDEFGRRIVEISYDPDKGDDDGR